MSRTAVKRIPIYDEGILLTDDVRSIDFIGGGVIGSVIDRAVTESISGASSSYADGVALSPAPDDVTTAFTLPNTPSGTPIISLNGVLQQAGASGDYTLSGANVNFAVAPPTGSPLLAWYRY